jgi:phage tail sheath gpL-like
MINTGVPSSLNVPQTFHTFTYLYANRSLISLPMRLALVGLKTTAAPGVAGTVYEVADPTQTDALFGLGSELALMCRIAFATSARLNGGPRVYAVGVAEPGASVAATKTLTVTGTATADGNIIVRLAGRTYTIGVQTGAVQNSIATLISNAIKANDENNPMSIGVATNVVTGTFRTTGINGNDVAVSVEQTVAGVSVVAAAGVTGTGTPSIQTAIDALATLKYDAIAFGNHYAGDITIVNTDIPVRWGPTDKGWRYYFFGEIGTIGTATSLAAAANHQAVVISSLEGSPSLCGEIATATAMGVFSRSRPNATYNGLRLPLYPPVAATAYTGTEKETAIAAGLTPLEPVIDSTGAITAGVSRIVRLVTTKTTSNSQPFTLLRDIGVSRTGIYLARQLDAACEERFGADANPDGTLQTDDTLGQVGDVAKSIMRAASGPGVDILRNVESDISKLVVERDEVTLGRTNVDLWYTVVIGQHQIAWKHNVQV